MESPNSAPVGIRLFNKLPIRDIRPETRSLGYRYFTLGLTFFIYCSYHASRKAISVVKDVLHPDCNNTNHVTVNCTKGWAPFDGDNGAMLLGYQDVAFLAAYAVGMFITGHIAERMNLRTFLVFGMLTTGFFTILFGMGRFWNVHSLWYYMIIQILTGLFQSTGWPPVVNVVANWFGKGRRGLVMGLWNSHTSLGNILGGLIAAIFVNSNWGLSFIVPGCLIAGMGIITFFFLVPHPKDVGCESPERTILRGAIQRYGSGLLTGNDETSAETAPLVNTASSPDVNDIEVRQPEAISFWRALQIPGVVEFSICLFFSKLVSYTFLFWLPNYISNSTPYGASFSAVLSTVFDIGGIIGGVVAGVVSDRTGASALTCLVMLAFAAPFLLMYSMFGSAKLVFNVILLIICGALVNGPYSLITTAISADLGSHHSLQGNSKALSTVSAIIDGTGSVGAALGPLLTAILSRDSQWSNVFYMLIVSDLIAMLVSAHIYYKYDRHKTTASGRRAPDVTTSNCLSGSWFERLQIKPTCMLRPRVIIWPSLFLAFLAVVYFVRTVPALSAKFNNLV